MMVVRPVEERDREWLEQLTPLMAQGLTGFSMDLLSWQKKIHLSLLSFATDVPTHDELYFFVLEDLESGQILGTSQIQAKTNGITQGYNYHIETIALPRSYLSLERQVTILRPVYRDLPSTEIGGLFLSPGVRQRGLSRLLSLCRLLFIASHPNRFQQRIIAEMCAHLEPDGSSLFWNAVGRHFLNVDYENLMQQIRLDPSFIPATVPPFPIYVPLLSPDVQRVIGKTHPLTQRALHLLLDEGFHLSEDVDLFDAGPKVYADTSAIHTMRNHVRTQVIAIRPAETVGSTHILSNEKLTFRACLASVAELSQEGIAISPQVAKSLQVNKGDWLRIRSVKTHLTHRECHLD